MEKYTILPLLNENDPVLIRYLCENKADINVKGEVKGIKNYTPLMVASEKGFVEIVKILCEYKADVNYKNDKGENALVLSDNIDVTKILYYYGADINSYMRFYLMANRMDGLPKYFSYSTLEFLIDAKADVNLKNRGVNIIRRLIGDINNAYILKYPNFSNVIKLLIKNKIDINNINRSKSTILDKCIKTYSIYTYNLHDIIYYLIESGAKSDNIDKNRIKNIFTKNY